MKFCECGCGQELSDSLYKGKARRFIHGHNRLGKCHSVETKNKIKEAREGIHLSKETKRKLRNVHLGKHPSKEAIEKMRSAHFGKPSGMAGKHVSYETKEKLSIALRGKNNHNWKGGITLLKEQIRKSFKSRQWSVEVFTRDDYTCQVCGERGGCLHAHHVESFSQIFYKNMIKTLEQALECGEFWRLENGITLCKKCHRKEHSKELNFEVGDFNEK